MTTFYGIEQSTDSRDPRTVVTRLPSKAAAVEFAKRPARLTYADAEAAKNWHHTLYRAFALPSGWRKPSPAALRESARPRSTRDYPLRAGDVLAAAIERDGDEVVAAKERPSP